MSENEAPAAPPAVPAAAATTEKKKRAPAEKAIEKVFATREEAVAAIPAAAKRLKVWKLSCKAGEAFVAAGSLNAAVSVFGRLALGVVGEDTTPAKKSKVVSASNKLDTLLAEIGTPKTKEAQELAARIKAIKDEIDQARAARKTPAAAPAAPPAVPGAAPVVPPAVPAAT